MLQRLIIRNYALIEDLDIVFSEGLNIITGETGAGKSIIMGALSLILGNRAESRYFFNQQKKCVIEGYFKIEGYNLQNFFDENELDYEAESVLRREVSSEGKSRSFINDTPVNLNTLKQLGELLIDIHSQHATLEINDEAFQLLVVDTLGANAALLDDYRKKYNSYRQLQRKLTELKISSEKTKHELGYLQYQVDEFEQANLTENEQELLEAELKSLTHAEEIKKALLASFYLLTESEQSATINTKESLGQIQQVAKYSAGGNILSERLQSVLIELKDIAAEIEALEQRTIVDELRTAEVAARLSTIYSLQKKHQVNTVHELLSIQRDFEEKIRSISLKDDEILKLGEELHGLYNELIGISELLSASRNAIIPSIEQKVRALLSDAGMPHSILQIENTLLQEDALNVNGRNRISFRFSANKGQIPSPVSKVASGGELSRLMLSIKSLISKHIALPTIIFDEIDTGISGEIALKVGNIMEKLSVSMQVIAITHLPQIASKGDAHYCVFKDDRQDSTHTNIRLLKADERVFEIAKMLGGDNPGEAALKHAGELLNAGN